MEHLIPVVNKLQDAFSSLGQASPIDLPQIAVVGGQSAGKSSVLENFVGKDFLPRGAGIVTRRPLVLQLINSAGAEYGEFLHKPNNKMTDFLQIRAEIEAETDRVTGSNKNISALPINLRVYSPHVLNLTLVDLPGLTKVPVGDQPKDIDQQIRKMVVNFISNPNCLILAVTPANIDLANSDALLLAREVDPQGLRTIGVITKIDLMDRGTNCRDVLLNITYPLKRGYVGVVNRSQADIDGRKKIQEAQQAEYTYFATHESYRDIASKCGTQHLQNVLNKQLTEHIKNTLPSLKKKLMEQMMSIEHEVKSFSDDLDTPAGRARQLMTLLQDFSNEIDQNLGFRIMYVQTDHLTLGSKINKILTERFPYEIKKLKGSIDQIRNEIALSIQNSQGVRNTIFTPEAAFTTICRKKIHEIRPIVAQIIDKVGEIMSEIIDDATITTIKSFSNLQDELKLTCTRELNECISEAKTQASKLIDFEYCHINTTHPDFIDISDTNKYTSPTGNPDEEHSSVTANAQTNTVYRKGFLGVSSTGIIKNTKDHWFVIRGETLQCYKDGSERDLRFTLHLNDLKTRPIKKSAFALVTKDGRPIGKDMKQLELFATNEEECEDWKASLMARGVFPELPKSKKNKPAENGGSNGNLNENLDPTAGEIKDPVMFKQIEMIRTLVESYLRIVIKSQIDIVSKLTIYLIVERMCTFVKSDLIALIYSRPNNDELLDINESEKQRKLECIKIHSSCKQALSIINEVMNNNMATFKLSTSSAPPQQSNPPMSTMNVQNQGSMNTFNNYNNQDSFGIQPNYGAPQPMSTQQFNAPNNDMYRNHTSSFGQGFQPTSNPAQMDPYKMSPNFGMNTSNQSMNFGTVSSQNTMHAGTGSQNMPHASTSSMSHAPQTSAPSQSGGNNNSVFRKVPRRPQQNANR